MSCALSDPGATVCGMIPIPPPVERSDPPDSGDERTLLDAWLDFHRATLLRKCSGLSEDQLRQRSVPPSSLSLLGLVRHLTEVERGWFRRGVLGEELIEVGLLNDSACRRLDGHDRRRPRFAR